MRMPSRPKAPFHSIKTRLMLVLTTLLLMMLVVVGLNLRFNSFIQETAYWRTELVEGRATFQEIVNLTHRLSLTPSSATRKDLLTNLEQRMELLDSRFHRLRHGDPKSNLPKATDPYIIEALDSTDRFWHEKIFPSVRQVSAANFDQRKVQVIENGLEVFNSAIEVGISISQEVIQQKTARMRLIQSIAILLGALLSIGAIHAIRRTAQRISEIALVADQINRGNWDLHASEDGSDELSQLGFDFNQMTATLIRERNFSENIITSMGEMFILVSPSGTILKVNRACTETTGYRPEELLNRDIRLLVPDSDFFSSILMNIQKYGFQSDSSVKFFTKNGPPIPTALSGTAILDTNGRLTAAALLFKDMTGYTLLLEETQRRSAAEAAAAVEKEKSEELRDLNEKLRESQMKVVETGKFAALGEMAGGIAHEINNPLAIIAGKAAQLRDLADDAALPTEKVIEIADKIENTAMRVARIIKGLRTFARDASQEPMVRVPVVTLIQDTLDLCREKFRIHGIDLQLGEISEDLTIECRSVQISQVLLNLLNNARDAVESSEERWIRIGFADLGQSVAISVSDSGGPIPAEVRAKLMQPFFTTKPPGKGTGLGLSISRSIVEVHAGTLALDPVSPNTCFVISLPKKQTETQPLAA